MGEEADESAALLGRPPGSQLGVEFPELIVASGEDPGTFVGQRRSDQPPVGRLGFSVDEALARQRGQRGVRRLRCDERSGSDLDTGQPGLLGQGLEGRR